MASDTKASQPRSSDFSVGDVVKLTGDRQGVIRFIGKIDGIGDICFGVELDEGCDPNGKAQDGKFGGKRYFESAPGRGTFVMRSKIKSRIKSVKKKTPKNKGKQARSNLRSPKPQGNRKTRQKGQIRDQVKRQNSRRNNQQARIRERSNPHTPRASISFDIPETATLDEKIEFILERLKDTKSSFKGRSKMITVFGEIFENEEKVDDSIISNAITNFKKPFVAQIGGKKISIIQDCCNLIVKMYRSRHDQFSPHIAFYFKKLVGLCKHSDPKATSSADKAVHLIIKEQNDKQILVGALIQAATKAQNKVIKKHSWEYLNETLKYYLPNTLGAASLTKEVLDTLAAGLNQGLVESDRHVKEQAMHVLSTLGLFDETRAERLISKMPTSQRRTFQQKFEKTDKKKDKKTKSSAKKAKSLPRDRPARSTDRVGRNNVTAKSPRTGGKQTNRSNSKGPNKKDPKTGRIIKKNNSKNGINRNNGNKSPNNKGNNKGINTKNKGINKHNKSSKKDSNSPTKDSPNGTIVINGGKGGNTNNKDNILNNNDDSTDKSLDDSHLGLPVSADTQSKRNQFRRNRGKNNSLVGSQDDEEITAALQIDFPELGATDDDDDNKSQDSPINKSDTPVITTDDDDSIGLSLTMSDINDDDNDGTHDDNTTNDDLNDDINDGNDNDKSDEEEGSDSDTSTSSEIIEQDPSTAIELIESFLELKDPQINWKMIEFLSKDNMTHLLMSYISRMPGGPKIWTENLDVDFDEIIAPTKALSSEEEDEIRLTKLSYSLMRILSNEHAAETVKSFLLRKCQEICLHALAVFHPRSKGNVYHGRVVLEILLNDWPKSFMGALANQKHIQKLLKCSLFRNLHQGNLNSFFLDLICYRPNPKAVPLQPIKRKLLKLFSDWQFMEYLLDVACSPKHGDDIGTKYATFFIDLVARSASIPEAAELFHSHEHLIIDSFMNALLCDDDLVRTQWHRIICGQTLVQFLDICSRPNIMDPAAAMAGVVGIMPEPSPNVLHSMFDKSLERLHYFIPKMCLAIEKPNFNLESIQLAGGLITKPFGQIRLNCMELLTVSADFAQFGCGKVLGKLSFAFWESLLDMAFIHNQNNMYLCHFRRLVHLSMIFRRRFLKHLFSKCKMLERLVEFYETNDSKRTTLHGYILQMLWDIYHHDQRDDENDGTKNEDENDGNKSDEDETGSQSSVIVNAEEEEEEEDGSDKKKDGNNEDDDSTNSNNNSEDKPPTVGGLDSDSNDKSDKTDNNSSENDDDSSDGGMTDDDEKKNEFTEEDLILRPNFSREPEDHWDIVQFFKNNEGWKSFETTVTKEMELQNNADAQLPNPMQGPDGQLDALLQNLLGGSSGLGDEENDNDDDDDDSSSDDSSEDD